MEIIRVLLTLIAAFSATGVAAREEFAAEKILGIRFEHTEIKTTKIAAGIYSLEGAGGNIAVSVGADGVFLVDDQFAPLSEKLKAAIAQISDQPIRFVLNTHYHPDHVGGNLNLAAEGVVILAHNNVRRRLQASIFNQILQLEIPPAPPGALPIISYADALTFHLNEEEIHAFHIPPAHTDGDSFVHFKKADVIHAGDVFRTTSYPVVDVAAGGSYIGIVRAYEQLLDIAGPATKIIPGHGTTSSRSDVENQYKMLLTILKRIQVAVEAGNLLAEVQAMKPTAEYDSSWGSGRISGEMIVDIVYRELLQAKR